MCGTSQSPESEVQTPDTSSQSPRELVRKAVEESLFRAVPNLDPHDDEAWVVDRMMAAFDGCFPTGKEPGRDADLVCEALVREIGRAKRWQSVEEAWLALLHSRRMAKELDDEGLLPSTLQVQERGV